MIVVVVLATARRIRRWNHWIGPPWPHLPATSPGTVARWPDLLLRVRLGSAAGLQGACLPRGFGWTAPYRDSVGRAASRSSVPCPGSRHREGKPFNYQDIRSSKDRQLPRKPCSHKGRCHPDPGSAAGNVSLALGSRSRGIPRDPSLRRCWASPLGSRRRSRPAGLRSTVENNVALVTEDDDLPPGLDDVEAPTPRFLNKLFERGVPLHVVTTSANDSTRPHLLSIKDLVDPCHVILHA